MYKRQNKIVNALRIVEISKSGPLYGQGVRADDIIIEINDDEGSWINLTKSLRFAGLGNDIKLRLFSKNGDEKLVEITSKQTRRIN